MFYWTKKINRLMDIKKNLTNHLDKAVKNQARSLEQTKLRTSIERRNRNHQELQRQSENIKASIDYTNDIKDQGTSIISLV